MIKFPSTVLLATDGSSHVANARRAAAEISIRAEAPLHLVYAWRRESGPLALPHEENRNHASSMLAHEGRLLADVGATVAATHAPEGGWRGEQILSVARGVGADLLVIGSRHLGLIRRSLSPPTSEALLRLAVLPLLVVRDDPGAWPPARLIVGDDGSRAAHDAGVLAGHLGRALGWPVDIVEVLDPEVVETPAAIRALARVDELIGQRAAALEEEVGTPLSGSHHLSRTAIGGLAEAGTGGDGPVLIAVGHRITRRAAEAAQPSVASRLLSEASASLLICPSGALPLIRRRQTAARLRVSR